MSLDNTPTPKSKLTLDDLYERAFNAGYSCYGPSANPRMSQDEFVDAVSSLLRELVPEKNRGYGYGSNPDGWNACRNEMLKKIDGLSGPEAPRG